MSSFTFKLLQKMAVSNIFVTRPSPSNFPQVEEEEIAFKRRITPKGTSEYYIDNSRATWEEYNEKLMEYNILIKARNFLVFQVMLFIREICSTNPAPPQGDVEGVASKSPKDLTELIEQISGSGELKKEYDELALEKDRAEETTIFNFQKRKGIFNEKKVYKEQKEEAERFNKLIADQVLLHPSNPFRILTTFVEIHSIGSHALPTVPHREESSTKR